MCSWSQYAQHISRAEGWHFGKGRKCIDNRKIVSRCILRYEFVRRERNTHFTKHSKHSRICCSCAALSRRYERTSCRKSVCLLGTRKKDKHVKPKTKKKKKYSSAARLRYNTIELMHKLAPRSHSWTPANVLIIMLCGAQNHIFLFFVRRSLRLGAYIQKISLFHFRAWNFTATGKRSSRVFIAVHH